MPGEAAICPCLIIGVIAGGDLARTERAVGDALQHRAVAVGDGVDIAQGIRVQVTEFAIHIGGGFTFPHHPGDLLHTLLVGIKFNV